MNIALITDDYIPHSTRIAGKMLHELSVCLNEMGHSVTVITPHFSKQKFIQEEIDNIKIWRFKSGIIKNVNLFIRAINESFLSYRAWNAIKKKVTTKSFDAVIYYSPSIFWGYLVKNLKKRCRCKSYLILRDLFPQWVVDAGIIKKNSFVEKYFRYFEGTSYNQADTIGLMSEKNLEVFNSFVTKKYNTTILRNWGNLAPHKKLPNSKSIRTELNLNDKIIFFYGGNIGHAQDMENLMRLAKSMQSHAKAHFLFVGEGDEVSLVQSFAAEWELKNFTYISSVSQDEFKDILTEIDVGLFSLSKNHTAHNFPGKLLGYMVQSIPILGSVNKDNDLAPLINNSGAGFISVNGEDEALLKNAIALYENKDLRQKTGKAAYELLKNEFDVQKIAEQIVESVLKENS